MRSEEAQMEYRNLSRVPAYQITDLDLLAMRESLNRLGVALERMREERKNYEERNINKKDSPPSS